MSNLIHDLLHGLAAQRVRRLFFAEQGTVHIDPQELRSSATVQEALERADQTVEVSINNAALNRQIDDLFIQRQRDIITQTKEIQKFIPPEIPTPCPFCGKVPAQATDRYDPSEVGVGGHHTVRDVFFLDPGYVVCLTRGCALYGFPIPYPWWECRAHRTAVTYRDPLTTVPEDGRIPQTFHPNRKD